MISAESDSSKRRLLDLCACEGGATVGYQKAGFHVTAVDLDAAALRRNPADETIQADALEFLRTEGHKYDAIHASFPCQRWAANGANPAADKHRDLITRGRDLLNAMCKPWVMENVKTAPLRQDLVLCGTHFNLYAIDTDGTKLYLKRHRVFESNVSLAAPGPCLCGQMGRQVQWAGVYGGARKDKVEARTVRKGGYVPPDATVQGALLGGVDWMTGKGRRECIPPVYAEWVGRQLLAVIECGVRLNAA